MKIFLVVSCCLLSALCVVESVITKAAGVVGGQVTIQCSYADKWFGKSNDKYFCRKNCDSYNDILVQTQKNKNYIERGRYTIHDKRNGDFTVTIKNLVKSDSGTYWCGVDRSIKVSYQEVRLTVTDAPPKPSTVTSRPNFSTTFLPSGDISVGPSQRAVLGPPVVIMVCVSLAVLVVGLILLLIYKWRRDRTSSRPVTNPDTTTQDSTYQTLNTTTQDSTYQTLNTTTQDSTYQTLNTTTQDSTYQTLNTTTQDSTYQTLNTTTQDSTYKTLISKTTDPN
ncbi:CMRF35-like molecule 1 [Salmo trutta]|uniref:CMRF35-like molecule 1 n=1 Tax=Salmo trutta TaxID=8032 RepID=UPI001130D030|nr:CMRF35-like molecule 1 [Salmo trutta]